MRFNIFINNNKNQIFINVFYIFNILLNLIFKINLYVRKSYLYLFKIILISIIVILSINCKITIFIIFVYKNFKISKFQNNFLLNIKLIIILILK